MFEFKPEYLVGVTAIDEQHKQLFRLAARFHDAIVANRGKAMLDELLTALVRYTAGHFLVEERLMAAIDYPEREQHMAAHRDLRERLRVFQERFDGGETAMTIQLLQFLSRWLAGHTTSTDRRLGEYYRMTKESKGGEERSTSARPPWALQNVI
ncbi:MAG: bacteriohemerythrin [Bryobacteraceae bacterium]|jgi:hemerythrin-like metal-binding protein